MGRGRDAEAVAVVHAVAQYNGVTSTLTEAQLARAGAECAGARGAERAEKGHAGDGRGEAAAMDTSAVGAVRRQMAKFSGGHVRALFATRTMAWSTGLLVVIWGA